MKVDLKNFIKVTKAIMLICTKLDFAPKDEIAKAVKIPNVQLTNILDQMEQGRLIKKVLITKEPFYQLNVPKINPNAKIKIMVTD